MQIDSQEDFGQQQFMLRLNHLSTVDALRAEWSLVEAALETFTTVCVSLQPTACHLNIDLRYISSSLGLLLVNT
jgi:hypothetical protein